jgi:hypothetical protein
MRRGVRSLEARCAALARAGIPLPRSYRARLHVASQALARVGSSALVSPHVYTVAHVASSRGWTYLGEGWNLSPAHVGLTSGSGTVHAWQWRAASGRWESRRYTF